MIATAITAGLVAVRWILDPITSFVVWPGGLLAFGIVGDSEWLGVLVIVCPVLLNTLVAAGAGALVGLAKRVTGRYVKRYVFRCGFLGGIVTASLIAATLIIDPMVGIVISPGLVIPLFFGKELSIDESLLAPAIIVNGAIGAVAGAILSWIRSRWLKSSSHRSGPV